MKRIYITLGILLFLGIITAFWWINGSSAANPEDKTPKIFIIEKGQGVRIIAKNLKDQGLIKDPIVFFLITKKLGLDNKIEAGDFRLFPSMSASQIAKELTHGTLDIWITVPEGQRALQIAESLRRKMPNYDASWDARLEENEGYLFPDTYLFPKDANIETIITIMRDQTFEPRYKTLDIKRTDLSQEEIVTVASLVEREARHPQDRPLIASVIYNRLSLGMALQVDATIQYAKGQIHGEWWTSVTQDEYTSVRSSYNTYLNPGLPPGPIANPGISSLQAAANPADSSYLYYITDKNGVNRYAETLAQHQANIKKYGL